MLVDAFAGLGAFQCQQQVGFAVNLFALVIVARVQVFKLDGHVLGGVERDDAVEDVAPRVAMYGLHLGIDDNSHIEVTHILTVDFLDKPRSVHRVKVVTLEHQHYVALAVHQIHVLGIVLCF